MAFPFPSPQPTVPGGATTWESGPVTRGPDMQPGCLGVQVKGSANKKEGVTPGCGRGVVVGTVMEVVSSPPFSTAGSSLFWGSGHRIPCSETAACDKNFLGSVVQAPRGGNVQASPGGDVQASPGGDVQASPDGAELATPGDGEQATPGKAELAATPGKDGQAANPDEAGQTATSGDAEQAATSGYAEQAATLGRATSASPGDGELASPGDAKQGRSGPYERNSRCGPSGEGAPGQAGGSGR
ncbi:UNVERIFIED_CONTAM: hypothetical protein FKN15_028577 [Acipenser sinensis]